MEQPTTVRMLYVFALLTLPAASHAEEQLKAWWARTPPPIEEISGGNLKVGDMINKATVEHVKDYMPRTYYLDTLDAATWEITAYTPGEELMPQAMIKATKENLGKAVISPTGTVTMADGSAWIGGSSRRSLRRAHLDTGQELREPSGNAVPRVILHPQCARKAGKLEDVYAQAHSDPITMRTVGTTRQSVISTTTGQRGE